MHEFIAYKMGQPDGHVLRDEFMKNFRLLMVNFSFLSSQLRLNFAYLSICYLLIFFHLVQLQKANEITFEKITIGMCDALIANGIDYEFIDTTTTAWLDYVKTCSDQSKSQIFQRNFERL